MFPWFDFMQQGGSLCYGGQIEVSYNESRVDEDQVSLMFFSILPSPAYKSCVKVGETQGMKNKVAKSEKNQLRVGESSVCLFGLCLFV